MNAEERHTAKQKNLFFIVISVHWFNIFISPSMVATHTLIKQEIIKQLIHTRAHTHAHTHTKMTLVFVDSYAQHVYQRSSKYVYRCTVVLIVLTFYNLIN